MTYRESTEPIREFRGEHRYLSNFYEVPGGIEALGMSAPTTEHIYQAAKTTVPQEIDTILAAASPGQAKRLGQTCTLSDDWNERRLETMIAIQRAKYANPEMARRLRLTAKREIVEGNTWGDTFWGVDLDSGEGSNHLGKIIMQIRSNIVDGAPL